MMRRGRTPRYEFPAEGGWDIVAGTEAAGIADAQVRRDDERGRLPVRSHPWLPPGMVIGISKDTPWPAPFYGPGGTDG